MEVEATARVVGSVTVAAGIVVLGKVAEIGVAVAPPIPLLADAVAATWAGGEVL